MEQEYLFLHKNFQHIITIKTDNIDHNLFKKTLHNMINNLISNNNLNGSFKLINLYNASYKKYNIYDKLQIGGNNSQFNLSWANLISYFDKHIDSNNINIDIIQELYNDLLISGESSNIHKDDIIIMFHKLLLSYHN